MVLLLNKNYLLLIYVKFGIFININSEASVPLAMLRIHYFHKKQSLSFSLRQRIYFCFQINLQSENYDWVALTITGKCNGFFGEVSVNDQFDSHPLIRWMFETSTQHQATVCYRIVVSSLLFQPGRNGQFNQTNRHKPLLYKHIGFIFPNSQISSFIIWGYHLG